jgi:hypothetical protein
VPLQRTAVPGRSRHRLPALSGAERLPHRARAGAGVDPARDPGRVGHRGHRGHHRPHARPRSFA